MAVLGKWQDNMTARRIITADPPPREEERAIPIRPSEINKLKNESIPDAVIHSFNHLIIKNWNGRFSEILKEEVIKEINLRDSDITESTIYDNHWLDIENLYESYGWNVKYKTTQSTPYFTFSIEE